VVRKPHTAATASRSNCHCRIVELPVTSITKFHGATWRSFRHLDLGFLLAAPPPSTTYPHGGSLPPRHLFFTFKPLRVFLRHSHLYITSTAAAYIATNVPLPPRQFVSQPRQVFLWHSHEQVVPPYNFHKLSGSPTRHLVPPILTATPPPTSSTTHPHGGTLTPRHLVFHFHTTSGLPQALLLHSKDPISARSCFSLSNHVRFSSGTPTFEVHEQVVPAHNRTIGLRRPVA
jgi:hypothetical protein